MNNKHKFTQVIFDILNQYFGKNAEYIFQNSSLLQYLNIKTKSANKGSKSRPSLGNHYALYVLVEDYINKGFYQFNNYEEYEGAKFEYNIAIVVKEIIDAYVNARQQSFRDFMSYCDELLEIENKDNNEAINFLKSLLRPNIDARVFEITSYAILKSFYAEQSIFWGYSLEQLIEYNLILYKTGRTNENDGCIDFVMKPLGRFFQVTETIDVNKYFLDIDKIQRYPITFVVKSNETPEKIKEKIKQQAKNKYKINAIVKRYLESIEEIINLPLLHKYIELIIENGKFSDIIKEIAIQSQLEFNLNPSSKK
ncbi:MAG: restriction endonuclease [Crocosphaera sp.]